MCPQRSEQHPSTPALHMVSLGLTPTPDRQDSYIPPRLQWYECDPSSHGWVNHDAERARFLSSVCGTSHGRMASRMQRTLQQHIMSLVLLRTCRDDDDDDDNHDNRHNKIESICCSMGRSRIRWGFHEGRSSGASETRVPCRKTITDADCPDHVGQHSSASWFHGQSLP